MADRELPEPTAEVHSDLDLSRRVQAAHGDAWQAEGRLRVDTGGGAAELPGIRLMASGIAHPQWNNGDVTDPALVDVEAVRRWYDVRGVPWGVRVPAGMEWPHGRRLFRKRCMALRPDGFAARAGPDDVRIVAAGRRELETVVRLDATAFHASVDLTRQWVEPHVGTDGFLCVLAVRRGEPVGVATGVRATGRGGESVAVFGVGVLDGARGHGLGAALTSFVVAWGFAHGADLAWLNPDSEVAAGLYGRLGFTETAGFDVYGDL